MLAEPVRRPACPGPSALIGHTGFVGGNLDRQAEFSDRYRSTTIDSMAGRHYALVVCAGAPGVKWKANKEPDQDRASVERLMRVLERVTAERAILISTVDVYPDPRDVDESTPIATGAGHPYGRHRLELEQFFASRFDTLTVRLPGLFGPGLRKNVIFDLLTGNALAGINPESEFQFYPLPRLWDDIDRAQRAGLGLVNFATEPVSVRDVARVAFGQLFENAAAPPPVRYDMQTVYGATWDNPSRYMLGRDAVLSDMAMFVAWHQDHGG